MIREYTQKLPPILTRKVRPNQRGIRELFGSTKRVMSTKQMMKRTIISTMFSTVAANINQTVFIFLDIVIFLRFRAFKEQTSGKEDSTDNQ